MSDALFPLIAVLPLVICSYIIVSAKRTPNFADEETPDEYDTITESIWPRDSVLYR